MLPLEDIIARNADPPRYRLRPLPSNQREVRWRRMADVLRRFTRR